MPEATVKRLAEKLPRLALSNSYGATETTAPVALMPSGENMKCLDSVGQIVPCDEVIVVDPDGKSVAPGETANCGSVDQTLCPDIGIIPMRMRPASSTGTGVRVTSGRSTN